MSVGCSFTQPLDLCSWPVPAQAGNTRPALRNGRRPSEAEPQRRPGTYSTMRSASSGTQGNGTSGHRAETHASVSTARTASMKARGGR